MNNPFNYRLRFGIHKNKMLCEIPMNYLWWLLDQPWLDETTGIAIEEFLEQHEKQLKERK